MDTRQTDQLLVSLQAYARGELASLLDFYFDQAESHLLQLAFDSASISEHAHYFETITNLRQNRAGVSAALLTHASLVANAAEPGSPETPAKPGDQSELELLDLDLFDAQLALRTAIGHGEERWSHLLYGVERRVGELVHRDIDNDSFALGVASLSRALYGALARAGIGNAMMPGLLTVAEKALIPGLGDIYEEINERLKRFGVLPTLEISQWQELKRLRERGTVSLAAPAPVAAQLSPATAVGEAAPVATSLPEVAGIARRLLHYLRGAIGSTPGAAPVGQQTLLDALGHLQEQTAADTSEPLLQRLKSWLTTHAVDGSLRDEDADGLAFSDSVMRELVALLRDAPELRDIAARLEIPLATAALNEPALFESANHPAHQLVNHMGQLLEAGDVAHGPFGHKVREILDPLTGSGGARPATLSAVSAELARMNEQQLRARERSIQRLAETCDGQQKVVQAQAAVDRELHRRVAHIVLPQLLVDLIQAGWRELLRLAFLRDGEHGETWREGLNLLDELLWRFDRAQQLSAEQRQGDGDWLQAIDALTVRVTDCLETGFTLDHRHAPLIAAIRATLAGEQPIVMAASPLELPLRRQRTQGTLLAELEQAYPDLQRWFRRARDFRVGEVFTHFSDPERRQHTLIWIGAEQQRFVFVNVRGNKSYDHDLVDLARAMAAGFYPVDDSPSWTLVEKAVLNSARDAYQQIAFNSTHDPLTGLYNRREFERLLDAASAAVKNGQERCTLLYIDADQFALINELHGHPGGDAILQQLGQRLADDEVLVPKLARLAGNEFATLVPLDSVAAQMLAETVRAHIATSSFVLGEDRAELTVSIGVVEISKYAATSAALLRDAAYACDQAKRSGRNRIGVFDVDADTHARRDLLLGWINKLNTVMESDLLALRAQPIVPVARPDELKHYEILLALRGENGALMPPVDFIEAAECYNRMQRVDRWILEHAFRWLRDVRVQTGSAPTLSINLSANSLNDAGCLDFLIGLFGTYAVPPQGICFELTETATIDNLANAADFMRQAKKLGCSFALDDFGTGRSSYEYLKQLPVDYLKIDGMFIVNIARDQNDLLMVKSINEIAHSMGIRTIAEYVENDEVLAVLRDIGVDYAQGYGVGRPVLLADISQNSNSSSSL
jgi:diguanylate cyclase (GGDEF)-like protein